MIDLNIINTKLYSFKKLKSIEMKLCPIKSLVKEKNNRKTKSPFKSLSKDKILMIIMVMAFKL